MRPLKRIAKSAWFQGVLCRLAAQYIRLVHATGRWEVIGGDIPARYWDTGRPFIFAFWHGRLLLMAHAWRRGLPIHMLTSQHRDGQLIGRTMGAFGVEMVIGSTTRGGATALRGMVRLLKAGQYVGITPDGPRGPRMRATPGVVQVAKLSGAPIIPAAYSAARCRRLGSWDRFMVPLPFSRGCSCGAVPSRWRPTPARRRWKRCARRSRTASTPSLSPPTSAWVSRRWSRRPGRPPTAGRRCHDAGPVPGVTGAGGPSSASISSGAVGAARRTRSASMSASAGR